MPHLVVGISLVIMEIVIIILAVMILHRDRRFIYAYVAGLAAALVNIISQGVLGLVTPTMTIAGIAVSLIGASLMIAYFLRSQRVKAYFHLGINAHQSTSRTDR